MLGSLFEKRAAFQELWGSGALFQQPAPSGVRVTEEQALRLSAVYACVRLISDTISTLPVDQFIREDGTRLPYRPSEPWVQRPSLTMDRPTFYSQNILSLLLDGNVFTHISRDEDGNVIELTVLNPKDVEPMMDRSGQKTYRLKQSGRILRSDEVLHTTEMLLPGALRGVSRVEKAKDTLGLGLALEEYAGRFFGNGAYAGGIIEWPGDITPEQARDLKDSWEAGHRGLRRAHTPAVLYGGAKFTPTTANPSESQLLEERRFAVEEVARIFRVPPFMLGVTLPGSMSYSSVEQQMLFFAQHTIQPYVQRLEVAYSQLLADPRSFIRFNLNSLVRADLATRTAAYSTGLMAGFYSLNDVRALEDLRPVEGGDQHRVPLQNIPVTDAPIMTIREKASAAQALVNAGFDGASVARLLDLAVDHSGQLSVQVQPPPSAPEED
jgi:HK97 family phage portal protein